MANGTYALRLFDDWTLQPNTNVRKEAGITRSTIVIDFMPLVD